MKREDVQIFEGIELSKKFLGKVNKNRSPGHPAHIGSGPGVWDKNQYDGGEDYS